MSQKSLTHMKTRTDCRLCGSTATQRIVSLGDTPPANAFVPKEAISQPQEVFPLDVHICQQCAHVQLLDIVDPELLFRHYVYVSGTSPVFIDHFRRYAQSMIEHMNLKPGSKVVEIGSNDGTLLRFFKEAGMQVLGIDPALEIAQKATEEGIKTLPEFFDEALAQRLVQEGWDNVDLVVANNVFAHADDLHTITEGINTLLGPDGLYVFEVSYLVDVFQHTLFDTIYHEHLSYHSVKPLTQFFKSHQMELVESQRVDTHGGSLRGIAKKSSGKWPIGDSVQDLIEVEAGLGLHEAPAFEKLFADIQARKKELTALIRDYKAQGKKVVGFGAPAKATTLMYHFGLGPDDLEYIIDDSPLKQGLYSPGHHIPILSSDALYAEETKPDFAVILAWNFAAPIMMKQVAFTEAGGHFIVPLPNVVVH